MKKISKLTLLLFLLAYSGIASAQKIKQPKPSYKTAVGVKFSPLAVSIKSMSGKKKAFEFLGYFNHGFRLTVLAEYYGNINEDKNFKWYIGGGGHVGFASKAYGGDAKLGIDGVIGLDYKFKGLPLNLSIDWQPSYGFGDDENFTANWGGIGVRYCF